jgi:rare lipoprotein A
LNAGHLTIEAHEQSWPLDKPFRTSRGARTEARVVVVTVTDRGPFVRGRIVDVSLAAARALGIVDRGVARVRVERLPD